MLNSCRAILEGFALFNRLIRSSSGAMILVFAAAPSAATGIVKQPSLAGTPAPRQHWVGSNPPQHRRLGELHQGVKLSTPAGCAGNGVSSFVGENGGGSNFAGGTVYGGVRAGYAGILAGMSNESCDSNTAIVAGYHNVIGGDNSSPNSTIVGGEGNGIEGASDAFIGGGAKNLLSNTAAYSNSSGSGIASGYQNVITGPSSFIGSGYNNQIAVYSVTSNGPSAFIGAGANNWAFANFTGVVSGQYNTAGADNSVIVAGFSNLIGVVGPEPTNGASAFIGAGYNNSIAGNFSGILGGQLNLVHTDNSVIVGGVSNTTYAPYSFVGGGLQNNMRFASAPGPNDSAFSVIAGGADNSFVPPSANGAQYGVIAGGYNNTITGSYATIGGGHVNLASGLTSTVGGGYANVASGQNAAIPGGASNAASGRNSFAAGGGSHAANDGTFVWSDYASGAKILSSSSANQFLARASGGFYLYSTANLSTGVNLAPGSGSWSSVSDRAAKTAIQDVDDADILAKVASLPISEWSYTAQGTGVRHLGPMAQDFRAAFGLGEDDRHITMIDEEGVALAAVKALENQVADEARKLQNVNVKYADLDEKYVSLERRLKAIEARELQLRIAVPSDVAR